MRITDEMVVAASAVLYERLSCDYEKVGEIANAALTAALADVPETLQHRLRAEAYEELSQAQFRIAELEAQLASVQALPAEWERAADQESTWRSYSLMACAAELRERASKETP
jgi:hypothetical protein